MVIHYAYIYANIRKKNGKWKMESGKLLVFIKKRFIDANIIFFIF